MGVRVLLVVLGMLALAPACAAMVPDGIPDLAAPSVRPPLPDGRNVGAAIARARLTQAIDGPHARRWRADVARARVVAGRLTGARRAELATVLGAVDALAATGQLTPRRMPLAFLTLERNLTQWRSRAVPAAGERMTFGRDPAIFQYFPGRGIQFHPLATAGVANALAKPCMEAAAAIRAQLAAAAQQRAQERRVGVADASPPVAPDWGDCRPARLRATLDRLVTLSSRRGTFTAWEYQFAFGGGTPPWISGMTQATAAQALARGAVALDDQRYEDVALSALGAFEAAPPLGVALPSHEYLMYSFNPGLHILNGNLQAVIGLHDLAYLTGSPRARRLYERGERFARGSIKPFDTTAWSRYSLAGNESTLSYHQLLTGFLQGLCDRLDRAVYCSTARRFAFYEHEPPHIGLHAPRTAIRTRGMSFSFSLSKISSLRWTVSDRHGVVAANALSLPRGRYPVTWTPTHVGRATVRVTAVGPEGLRATVRATVEVKQDPAVIAARRRARREAARRARVRREATARRRAARQRHHAAERRHRLSSAG